ncbi:MAG: hypothetical protein JWR69_64 [Pedosphaera sp.]|nr:hypothetical protein [Pedosphaera sp.]
MAACDAQSLVDGARCLECGIPPGMQWPVLVNLFCRWANMNCDAQSLVDGAKCIECGIPPGMQLPVLIALAAQVAGASTDPATLTDSAKCIECGVPAGMRLPVLISLLCQIVQNGGVTPATCDWEWTPANVDFWAGVGTGVDPAHPIAIETLTLNFSSILTFNFGFGLPNVTSVVFAKLVTAGVSGAEDFKVMGQPLLVSVSAPLLQTVHGTVDFNGNPVMTTLLMPQLRTVDGALMLANGAVTGLDLPLFTNLGGNFSANNNALGTVNIPNLVFPDGSEINFFNNQLTAASVNQILARGVASGLTSATISLNGGTNAAPTGQGLADKAALMAAGCTVSTN